MIDPKLRAKKAAPKKYELVKSDMIKDAGRTLFRIRALVAIETIGVSAGDLGGYVKGHTNLAHEGDAWVSGNARVSDDAQVSGNAQVSGDARVSDHFPMAVRSDGYTFILVPVASGPPVVIAGCQYRTVADYRLHTDDYGNPAKKAETLLILDFLEAQAAARFQPPVEPAGALEEPTDE